MGAVRLDVLPRQDQVRGPRLREQARRIFRPARVHNDLGVAGLIHRPVQGVDCDLLFSQGLDQPVQLAVTLTELQLQGLVLHDLIADILQHLPDSRCPGP